MKTNYNVHTVKLEKLCLITLNICLPKCAYLSIIIYNTDKIKYYFTITDNCIKHII